jgi:hypothetical protein
MTEEWIQWKPIEKLSSKYYIDSVIDMIDSFKIILSNAKSEKEKIEIIFFEGVDAYTRVEESFRVKVIHELDKKYGTEFYGDWTFFKVNNSEYIKWLSDQSYEWSDTRQFTHFCLVTADAILDVIADYEPTVTLID